MNQNIINSLFFDVSICNYKIIDPIATNLGEIERS